MGRLKRLLDWVRDRVRIVVRGPQASLLLDLRQRAGVSEYVAARVVNVDPARLMLWERGLELPDPTSARWLIEFYTERIARLAREMGEPSSE